MKLWLGGAAALGLAAAASAHEHPLGNTTLAWQPDPAIARVSAMNIDFHGGDYFVTWRAPGRVEKIEGRDCIVGGYFFFDVDDRYAFDVDETVVLELEVDRRRTDGFNLSYDHAVNPTAKQIRLGPAGEAQFERVTVELERARFANRKYEHTDFAIGALGAMQPQPKDVNGEIALCGLKVRRGGATTAAAPAPAPALGTLRLRVLGTDGRTDSARVGIYRADGSSPLASEAAVTLKPFAAGMRQWPLLHVPRAWPSVGRYVFYVDGEYESTLAPGKYTVVVSKGPEYRLAVREITVVASGTQTLDVRLERWTDMPRSGWYSADGHIHIARPTPQENARVLAYTSAEDIHVSNLLQVSSPGQRASYPQYAFGRAGDHVDGAHALVSGQESPRSSHRGHTIGLNASEYVWTEQDYFVYDRIGQRIRELGGLWGYAHVAIDAFNVRFGLATDVPLGSVRFLEILQMGFMDTRYYYDFLNLGYRLLPSAGSDYPFIRTAGSERMYAKIEGKFSPEAWFRAYEHGRSFVTSGPIIEFSVDDDDRAVEFSPAAGEALEVVASTHANPDVDAVSRLELVFQGDVVASANSIAGTERLELRHRFVPPTSGWLALRAVGVGGTAAHTAPVYVYVDGDRRTWKRADVPALAERYLAVLQEFERSAPNLDEDWERADTEHTLERQWLHDKPALDASIRRAAEALRTLARDAARD